MKGHIRARGKNTWAIVVELDRDPTTGKRHQKWITVHGSKKEAERRLAEVLHELNSGAYTEPAKITLGEFLDKWLEHIQIKVRPVTLASYRGLIRQHIMPTLGHVPLAQLQPLDLQRFYAAKLRDGRADGKSGGLSSRTVRYLHGLLREALGHAVKWRLVGQNAAEAAEPPRQIKHEMTALDPDAIQALLETLKGDRLYALYLLALTTGLRRGEILGLRWQDVDLDSAWLAVRQTLVKVNSRLVIQPDDYGLVFCTTQGRPLNPSNLRRHFMGALSRAGLPDIRIHDLRHTHATQLLNAGVNLKLVADRLGHATTRMTADTYAHVLPRTRDEVAAAVDKLFSRNEGLQMEGKPPVEGK